MVVETFYKVAEDIGNGEYQSIHFCKEFKYKMGEERKRSGWWGPLCAFDTLENATKFWNQYCRKYPDEYKFVILKVEGNPSDTTYLCAPNGEVFFGPFPPGTVLLNECKLIEVLEVST